MDLIKKCLVVSLAFALAGAIGASFATGTAQALVAALVQVANTTANPVPTSSVDATDPGRIPYQSTIDMGAQCSQGACFWEFGSPPAGHRIVIQHVSGLIDAATVPTEIFVRLNNAGSNVAGPASFLASSPTSLIAFDQAVQAYFDPTDTIEVSMSLLGTHFLGSGFAAITLTGYELDCSAAPCAAIAH